MRGRVVRALKSLDPIAVENPARPGTPDVNFIEGWIELKDVEHWPKIASTPLRVRHFTPQQKVWLARRQKKGGNVWLLLRVQNDWLLFDGITAAMHLGLRTRAELTALATRVWHKRLNEHEFRDTVRNRKGEHDHRDDGRHQRLVDISEDLED